MAYVDKNEFLSYVKTEVLAQITENTDSYIDTEQLKAIDTISGYLSPLYDCTVLFSQTSEARPAIIIQAVIEITLYFLHKRINPKQIPDIRISAFEYWMGHESNTGHKVAGKLQEMRDGKFNPPSLEIFKHQNATQSVGFWVFDRDLNTSENYSWSIEV
jgi:hypothetical protein